MLTSEAISPDKVRALGGAFGFLALGKVTGVTTVEQGMNVTTEGGMLAVRVVQDGLIRVKLFTAEESGPPSMASTIAIVENAASKESAFSVEEEESAYVLTTELLRVGVDKEDGSVTFAEIGGRVVARQRGLLWNDPGAVTARFAASDTVRYYGLGEKTGGLDKRGERYEMWNSDVYAPHVPEIDALYQSIPLLVVHEEEATYGLFLDNPGRTCFDMRSEGDGFLIQSETGSFDYYFIAGPTMKEVVGRYTSLTGRMELPPQWALGYHQSRYSYMSQDEVLELARTFREKDIPCDVIYLDIHYMEGYRVFTFDPVRFPDPRGMIAELKSMGIRIVPIVDPGVKLDLNYEVFREGVTAGYFCRKPSGEPFVGPVWPGQSVFPDFTEDDVSRWWGDLHTFYTEMGIEGAWNDMNEPAVFNESKTMDIDTIHGNNGSPVTHGEVHNLYGLLMSKATFEGLGRHLGGNRPFVLTRAGYAGIQRYAAVWTGDNRSFWEHMAMAMPMVLNLGLSGVSFAGPDIGGFAHHCSGELLARWTQMGALFPYCRNHSELSSIRQEPWSFGPEIEAICREYIGLRYRLMPLIYSVFRESAESGLPVIRPLVLEYPDDPSVANLSDQFLLGDSLLVAPIYRAGDDHRAVYLPSGRWQDYWTGETLEGGRHVLAYAPLDKLPLYVKAGGIIPHADVASSTMAWMDGSGDEATASVSVLSVDLYGGGVAESTFDYYEDDGLTVDYRGGSYYSARLLLREAEGIATFRVQHVHNSYAGGRGKWRLTFKGLSFLPHQVGVKRSGEGRDLDAADGDWTPVQAAEWQYDKEAGELTIEIDRPMDSIEITVRAHS